MGNPVDRSQLHAGSHEMEDQQMKRITKVTLGYGLRRKQLSLTKRRGDLQ